MSERDFDVVVLGAGPAGEVLAGRLGEAGKAVAVVEPDLVGGECSFYSCMPSKSLLRPAEALAEVRRIPGAAEAVTGELDVAAVLARRDEVIHELDDGGAVPWLEQRGIELVRGHGRLDGERRVRVGDDVLIAREVVVVATGSYAALPPISGLAEARPWTNREITTAKAVVPRLAILGGGVVGCEMAQAWRSLGSQVTLIEGSDRLLQRHEAFAGDQVADSLREQGVDVRLGTQATEVRRDGDVTVELSEGPTVAADELLVAVGRRPHSDDIGLESVGLEVGRSITVDDLMRAEGLAGGWLYAIGDVNGRSLLTHMGKYQARALASTLLGKPRPATRDDAGSPQVVFTAPQVAAVGYTLARAQADGLDVRAVDRDTSMNAGGSFYGRNARGTSRLVIDEGRQVIVGATFTGADVQDFLHAATIAVVGEVPLDRLREAVPSFPTRSEVWLDLFEEYGL